MDELVLRRIVAAAQPASTLATLACTSRLLRSMVADELQERGHCREFRRLLGVTAEPAASARAAALLGSCFRRQFLADLAEAQQRGACWDARRHTLDLVSLPDGGRWLGGAQLLVSDLQYILLYDRALALLGALAFTDRPAGMPRVGGSANQPRTFFGTLCSLLFKCPLHYGLFTLEPPLLLGAPDFLLHQQLQPTAREALAAGAAAADWRRRLGGPDDDAHLVRLSLQRLQLLQRVGVAGGSLGGSLDDAFVRQMSSSDGCPSLRFLDVSGSEGLSDIGAAALLELCPNLRVLHAAGSRIGSLALAALAGRQQRQVEPEAQPGRQQRYSEQRLHANSSADVASEALQGLHLSPGRPAARQGPGAAPAPAPPQPACPLLERLDLSGCRLKGSALRRALRCLPHLVDLRLSSCRGGTSGLHAVVDPLLSAEGAAGSGGGGSASGSSSKAAVASGILSQLIRLECLDADDLTGRHVCALLRHCTRLRRLALSGKQLAAEQFDRQQHATDNSRPDASSNSSRICCGSSSGGKEDVDVEEQQLPSLLHLEVGWGTGGTFLLHLAQRHGGQLASLTVHAGTAASDWLLCQLAASCRHLARVCLNAANVSDAGVTAILQHCTQLTSLQLLGCTGPLTDALGGGLAAPRPPAFQLQELQVAWGAVQLTDAGLPALLRFDRAALRVLVLKGCSSLSDGAWEAIAQHGGTLECLHLESCGSLPALGKAGSSSHGGHAPLTVGAALEGLAACMRLLALSVRGCTLPWSPAEVERLQAACTALQTLDLGQ